MHGEACALQQAFEIAQRTAFRRCDGRTAQQFLGDGKGVGVTHAGISRAVANHVKQARWLTLAPAFNGRQALLGS